MIDIYSPGQAEILFEYWPEGVEWFLIGGPADANEAQTLKAKYPSLKCMGFEPNEELRLKQLTQLNFPGYLYRYALWDKDKVTLSLTIPDDDPRSSTLDGSFLTQRDRKFESKTVPVFGRTLDSLSDELGPFDNCVLWLDIENSEMKALAGAQKLLASGKVLMVNLEVYRKPDNYMIDFLSQYDLELVETWNTGALVGLSDKIFRKRGIK